MDRPDPSKLVFYAISLAAVLGLSFAFGLYSGAKKTVVYTFISDLKSTIEKALRITNEEKSTLLKIDPTHFLQPARYDGTGVTVNDAPDDQEDLILLSGFFKDTNELRLIRRNGTIVARWPVRFSEIFPDPSLFPTPPNTDWNVQTHGALALPDGSVVFNFDYQGLVKLDRCGNVVWTLPRQTHHSVELAEGGGFWVPGRRIHSEGTESPFPPFATPFSEDTILKVSEDGRVLTEISVPQLFYANGLEALLTAGEHEVELGWSWDHEIVHLNKIEELSSDIAAGFPMFKAGDLLLSIRDMNLLMVVEPDTARIKWWQIGPWLRQHDPQFKPGGTIVVFNNNIYRTAFTAFEKGPKEEFSSLLIPRISNIIEYDPVKRTSVVRYGNKKSQELLTVIRGGVVIEKNDRMLITEFEGGRVIEVNNSGRILWEYINRYSDHKVAEITDAHIYNQEFFTVIDWSCKEGRHNQEEK